MNKVAVFLTEDEFMGVVTSIEHFLDYLEDHGKYDYGEELDSVRASIESAWDVFNRASRESFS